MVRISYVCWNGHEVRPALGLVHYQLKADDIDSPIIDDSIFARAVA